MASSAGVLTPCRDSSRVRREGFGRPYPTVPVTPRPSSVGGEGRAGSGSPPSAAVGEDLRHGEAVVLVAVDDPPRLGEARVGQRLREGVGMPAPGGRDDVVEGERRPGSSAAWKATSTGVPASTRPAQVHSAARTCAGATWIRLNRARIAAIGPSGREAREASPSTKGSSGCRRRACTSIPRWGRPDHVEPPLGEIRRDVAEPAADVHRAARAARSGVREGRGRVPLDGVLVRVREGLGVQVGHRVVSRLCHGDQDRTSETGLDLGHAAICAIWLRNSPVSDGGWVETRRNPAGAVALDGVPRLRRE